MFHRNMHNKAVRIASRTFGSSTYSRAFHSPFAVLTQTKSPLESMPSGEHEPSSPYQKQTEEFPKPQEESNGSRTYVVSQPDPANTHYEVPSGAYHNSASYNNLTPSEPPTHQMDSSSGLTPEHPNTAQRVPRNDEGVGESAGVRYRSAPGEMAERGGSEGGLGMMDKSTTKDGALGELADRNPPPLAKESELFSKKGLENAWKERK